MRRVMELWIRQAMYCFVSGDKDGGMAIMECMIDLLKGGKL